MNFFLSGGPVLLGHLLGWVLQKCKKWNISLNLATLMVAQMFKHASTMGQGYLGQRWRNLGKCVLRNNFFWTKRHHVQLIFHLNISSSVKCGTFNNEKKPEKWKYELFVHEKEKYDKDFQLFQIFFALSYGHSVP